MGKKWTGEKKLGYSGRNGENLFCQHLVSRWAETMKQVSQIHIEKLYKMEREENPRQIEFLNNRNRETKKRF